MAEPVWELNFWSQLEWLVMTLLYNQALHCAALAGQLMLQWQTLRNVAMLKKQMQSVVI